MSLTEEQEALGDFIPKVPALYVGRPDLGRDLEDSLCVFQI